MEISAEIISLYTNLFVLTMTIVGILLASLIALTQLLEPFLVSKLAQKLVRPVTFYVSVGLLILTVIATLPAMVMLSIEGHDFFAGIDFRSNALFTDQAYIAVAVAILLLSAVFVTLFIYNVSKLLIPVNALSYLRYSNKTTILRDYFQKSSATRPMRPISIRFIAAMDDKSSTLTIGEDHEESDKAAEKKYNADIKKYESDKDKLAKMENPLFPLEAYLTRSIQRGNLTIVSNTLKTFEEIISDLIADDHFDEIESIIRYYETVLGSAHELAEATGLQSISLELLESSLRVADLLMDSNNHDSLNALLEYWRTIAAETLNSKPTLFKRAVSIIGEVTQNTLRNKDVTWDSVEVYADNVNRYLGWLGEKLLENNRPETKTLMISDSTTQFGALMSAVLEIGWEMHSKRADVYPLIYFDCLYVIAKKLAPYCKDENDYEQEIGDSLFSLMYELFSFGEAAIYEGNLRGAGLALLKLEEHLKIAEQNNLEKHKQYILDDVLRLGAIAESAGIKGVPDFLRGDGDSLADVSIHLLRKHIHGHSLDGEAHEVLIKTSTTGKHEQVMNYLRRVGKALGTDFGMHLSERTE